jgi:phosphatidylserine/phosphatidylglycerophosphate/cardiolipin synthase-like enzyme
MIMAQSRVNPLAKLVGIVILAIAVSLVYQYRNTGPRFIPGVGQPEKGSAFDYFSPSDNLERADLDQLKGAKKTIDIAMYAFTDRYIAEQLVKLAERGVIIRIYRDREQYEQEQRRGGRNDSGSSMELFRGQTNIHVKVKGSRELMHLKAYLVDGALLRDGSANWSPSGLKRQDNNAHFTADPEQVKRFHDAFEEMWARSDNEEIQ